MPGVTSDGDGWAESDLLRFVVEVVNVPVQSHGTDRLQREILLRPHLRQRIPFNRLKNLDTLLFDCQPTDSKTSALTQRDAFTKQRVPPSDIQV